MGIIFHQSLEVAEAEAIRMYQFSQRFRSSADKIVTAILSFFNKTGPITRVICWDTDDQWLTHLSLLPWWDGCLGYHRVRKWCNAQKRSLSQETDVCEVSTAQQTSGRTLLMFRAKTFQIKKYNPFQFSESTIIAYQKCFEFHIISCCWMFWNS